MAVALAIQSTLVRALFSPCKFLRFQILLLQLLILMLRLMLRLSITVYQLNRNSISIRHKCPPWRDMNQFYILVRSGWTAYGISMHADQLRAASLLYFCSMNPKNVNIFVPLISMTDSQSLSWMCYVSMNSWGSCKSRCSWRTTICELRKGVFGRLNWATNWQDMHLLRNHWSLLNSKFKNANKQTV